MSRDALVQETWWEHHVVSIKPELNAILSVERGSFTSVSHSASSEDTARRKQVDVETTIVNWPITIGKEP
tara:strand:+ start:355 stop:564 length:210 start_codon:yes stop_codon:yes gene_type:complete